jgi:hypothetical protein
MAYTREQIAQALKAAHEAGDVEAARALAVAYRDWKPATPDPAMNRASERANMAFSANEKIAPADLAQLGRPDFSTAAMARLPAPTKSVTELDAFDAQKRLEKERMHVPDSDFKERTIAALNGPTWGNAPRLAAGMQTIGALAATPFVEGDIIDQKGISGATSQFLDEARIHQRRGREERGLETAAIEIVPALFQGKTVFDTLGKKFLPKTDTVSNVLRTVGVSALGGATYMGSQNESGTAEGVAQDAAFGGLLGAGFGVGMKVAEPGAIATYRTAKTAGASLYDAAAAALGRAGGARDRVAGDVAVAAVRRSMDRSGMTLDEIMALVKKYEGKPAVLAEVIGEDAVNALTALANRRGSTPQKALDIGEERAFGRPDRMVGDIEDATGIPAGQLDDTLEAQLEARQEAADPLYKALYKQFNKIEAFRQPGQTGQVMKRLNRLGRTPLAQRHLQTAKDAVATIAGRRGIAVSKMSTMEYWDLVKRSLDNAIDSAQKRGEGSTRVGEDLRDLVGLKNDLVDELDRLTGGAYAAAREAGGEAPRLRAAATAGQKALQARNPHEVAKTVAATLPQDLPALQAGMVDDLATRINKGTLLPNRFRRPDPAGKVRAVFGDDVGGKIIEKMDAEASLASSGAKWAPRTGPKTSVVLENGPGGMADDLMDAGINLASGNKLGLFRQAMNFMRQRGFSQRQIDAIGDLLLSSPEEGLRRLRMLAPDGVPGNALAPVAGGPTDTLPPSGGTPPAPNALAPTASRLGTRTADAAAIAAVASGGQTAQADTGDAQKRIDELTQSQTAAQQLVTEYEQGLKAFESLTPKEKQVFLKDNGFTGPNGEIIKPDGDVRGITGFAIEAYKTELKSALDEQKAERDNYKKEINDIRVALAQRPEKQTNPLIEKITEYGTYGAVAYGAHRFRGAMVKGSQVSANRAAAKANTLLTRLPVPPEAPKKTLLSRVPIVGAKDKARIRRETNAANKAQFATEERLAGRNIPPISPDPNSPDGLPNRLANVDEFDRQRAAGDFGPVSRIGRFMEPVNSRYRGSDLFVIGTGAADAYITEGMIKETRADIAAEEIKLATALAADDPDAIELSSKRLEQLRQAETVQVILQRIGIGMMIGGGFGLTHGRYARPQPRFEAAARERDLINRAMAPPPPPPANALAPPAPAPRQPRTPPAPKPKPPVAFTTARPRKPSNDNDR